MIISASRRTDIPAFFSGWFMNRIKEQYVYVRNPVNVHQVSKVSLSPDVVDCIVFWSKNPRPLLDQLGALQEYLYYFQFTLNAYGRDIEANLPPLQERIRTFRALSETVGKERVIWRYDPVIVNGAYTIEWHRQQFGLLADALRGYTDKVIISFIDLYPKIAHSMRENNIRELCVSQKETLAETMSAAAHDNKMEIDTCAEDIDLEKYGISHARCIDDRLITKLSGYSMDVAKDKNQRPGCGCVSGIDIGQYDTCQNGCVYCYANHSARTCARNFQQYDPASPVLCSSLKDSDKIGERRMASCRNGQLRFPGF